MSVDDKGKKELPPLKVAIAGLGTVGVGVLRVLTEQADLISERAGRPIQVVAVSARNAQADRGVDLAPFRWFDDATVMAREADADVVVELIGGAEGVARKVCETALDSGRHVVTANKALLAHHVISLAEKAEVAGLGLFYEAAVAGGIPIIKALREGLAANRVRSVKGILNGTCNYILTTMRETGREFSDVLIEAQELGYAEADPSFDIDGVDAAHKIALLASLAFGEQVDFDSIVIQGIRHVTALDITFATELGYRVKLIAHTERFDGCVETRVEPVLVPVSAPLSHVEGVYNAVLVEGDLVGTSLYVGRGAGAGPTASSVVADLIDIARGRFTPVFGVPSGDLSASVLCENSAPDRGERYYVRLMVTDRPGVFADIAAALRDEAVSMESIIQHGRNPGETVALVMVLHDTPEDAVTRAVRRIGSLHEIVEPPRVMRIGRF
ncbi:homoserine dehydrogenase [Phaeovibrio sulfidiphilus]|uniref:Homoserine dehydrogenase n=1 Tax=Phaeovibrio sulfidiphilus TaxID=1220600 RepID=A0A8J6YPF1_9PROT|nr:homoserine dehydrogenase [Phaeovibrio sulfidiphilus]MBE1237629.1 homoserine dehydrogenase [Phaeovibrio sulfidiphilus]